MAWPQNIQRAEARMEKAQDALRADIESGQYDSKRRNRLLKEFNGAFASFQNKVSRLAKSMTQKK